MSVSIKTDVGNYAINASRVEKFLTAQTRDQALHMGAFDKFKDLFRAADEKKSVQIAKIYDAITSPGGALDGPIDMAQRFQQLRDMAVDSAKPQFLIQSHKEEGGFGWSHSFSIGQEKIYQSPRLLDTHHESFESFSNFEKYFHGIETVVAAPEGNKDLDSSLQGVLHAMTLDPADTKMVLKALAQAQAILMPALKGQDVGDIRAEFLAGNYQLDTLEEKSLETDWLMELYREQSADQVVELYKSDPHGVDLLLARQKYPAGENIMSSVEPAIAKRMDELPRHQLLSLHDFFKRNPYFAAGLSFSGQPLMSEVVEDIESNEDMRIGLFGAKAALINDLGLIANAIFVAVETGLQQDIYRSSNSPTLPWRVDTEMDNAKLMPKDLAELGYDFVSGKQELQTLLSKPSPQLIDPEPPAQVHNYQLDPNALKA